MLDRAEVEKSRRRLLAWVFLILGAFASASVIFTLLGADVVEPLQLTPRAARFGVLALTLGFMALVWDKEREFQRLSRRIEAHKLVATAFENRLRVVETLLETGDKVNAPLLLTDILRVVLSSALEIVPAIAGSVQSLSGDEAGVTVGQVHGRDAQPPGVDGHNLRIALCIEDKLVGFLRLVLDVRQPGLDLESLELLERFCAQAARAMEKGRLFADERASVVYLEAANTVRANFLATVSHELRTPLTSIIGYAATLEHHWKRLDEAKRKEFVSVVLEQGRNLARMVERMLEAARLEMEGTTLEPVRHDLRNSLRSALERFGETSRIQLNLPDVPLMAEVDPVVIEQVVSNLVDNALRYTEGPVGIALRTRRGDVAITVSDRGTGFPAETLTRGIELDSATYKRSGAGLGLRIVKTLVEAHRGRIEVDRKGSGHTVKVILARRFRAQPRGRDASLAPDLTISK